VYGAIESCIFPIVAFQRMVSNTLPRNVITTAMKLAELHGVSPAHMTLILGENAHRVFRFAGVELPKTGKPVTKLLRVNQWQKITSLKKS